MKVYFDESGQTGTHLFDAAQPYFSLGSTSIEESEAGELLDRCFPRRQGNELKSQNVLRRRARKRDFLNFAREVGKTPERFCAVKIGKRFTVIAKMVDHLVEPLLRGQGYDFYAGNYAVRFANSAHFVFEPLLDRPIAENLLRLYNEFARNPTSAGLVSLHAALEAAERDGPDGSEVTLGLMVAGAEHFEELHKLSEFEDTNDIHVTAVINCMGHWQEQSPGPFEVIHDESLHFFARTGSWQRLIDPNIEPQVIAVGGKTLTLPIPVVSTVSARSHECFSLQICDLIAGFASRASAPGLSKEDKDFFRAACDAGLGEITVFPVDAGSDFADGPPARATGPDIIDRIATAARSKGES